MMNAMLNNQSVIISLDVDSFLLDRIHSVMLAGFTAIEVNSSDETLLKQILQKFPNLYLGAGNITNTQEFENTYQASVHFTTSPGFLPAIAQTATIYSANYFPGVATVSEAMQLMALGYEQARPLPATLSFCTLLNKCLPKLQLFPANVEWNEAEHYLSLPNVIAVSIDNPETKQLHALALVEHGIY